MPLGQRIGDKSDSRYCGTETDFDDDMPQVLDFNLSGGFDFIVSPLVHLELLYCPYGMENGFTNPFAPDFSMTSLEKALKSGTDGTEAANIGKTTTQKRREVIVRGVLSVMVISAEDLPATDLMGKADPFVTIQVKKTQTKNKTRVVNDSLNPVWNQTFDFVVEDGLHDMLILKIYDHDTFGKVLEGDGVRFQSQHCSTTSQCREIEKEVGSALEKACERFTGLKVFVLSNKAVIRPLPTRFDIQSIAVNNDFVFTRTKCTSSYLDFVFCILFYG